MQLHYHIDENLKTLSLFNEKVETIIAQNSDFWRLHLDTGDNRELTVFSSSQSTGKVVVTDGETIVAYDGLTAENGNSYKVLLEIHIKQEENGLSFYSVIDNRDTIRVNELQLPFFEFDKISSEPDDEILYIPNGLGERIPNPRSYVRNNCHTEYMAADYNNIWYTSTYPAPMSMGWMGIQSGNNFLYIAQKDDEFRSCCFLIGTMPRNSDDRIILTVSHYPFADQGEKITTAKTFAALYEGDWRLGAVDYKKWSEGWYRQIERPEWVKNMTGWQRIIMKHQYGEIYFKYEDLPKLYLDGKKYGINTLLVFGWWKAGFDNGYPQYEVDEALGGEQAFKAAIKEVQKLGGRILLYSNGKLIDVKTDFYKDLGKDICLIDIDLNEYREHYQFSNNGTVLRKNGYKSFVTACHATEGWKEQLVKTSETKLSFGPDSVFYDQIGGYNPKLCFNKEHKHKGRPDVEAVYRIENVEAITRLLKKDQAIGTEHITDIFSQKFHYIHGCSTGCWVSETQYPYLYRSVFPETIISNRFLHDDREDYREHLNNAFVYGLIFDSSIYRCRKATIAGVPRYAEHIKYLIEMKEKYHRFFYEGRFVSKEDYELPDGVIVAEYEYADEVMYAFANMGGIDKTFKFKGETVTVKAHDVFCLVKQKQ